MTITMNKTMSPELKLLYDTSKSIQSLLLKEDAVAKLKEIKEKLSCPSDVIDGYITKLSINGHHHLNGYERIELTDAINKLILDINPKDTVLSFEESCAHALKSLKPNLTRSDIKILFAFLYSVPETANDPGYPLKKRISEFGIRVNTSQDNDDVPLTLNQYEHIKETLKQMIPIPKPSVFHGAPSTFNPPIQPVDDSWKPKPPASYTTRSVPWTVVAPSKPMVTDPMAIVMVNALIDDLSAVTMSSAVSSAMLDFENFVIGTMVDYPNLLESLKDVMKILEEFGWHMRLNDDLDTFHGFKSPPQHVNLVIKNLCEIIGREYKYPSVDELIGIREFHYQTTHASPDVKFVDVDESSLLNDSLMDDQVSIQDLITVLISDLKEGLDPSRTIRDFLTTVNEFKDQTSMMIKSNMMDCLTSYGWNGSTTDVPIDKLIYGLDQFLNMIS